MVERLESHWNSLIQFLVVFGFWGLLTFDGLSSAVETWWTNDIFNHGFFIIPLAGYFIWLKREYLNNIKIQPALFPTFIVLLLVIIYVGGTVGEIRLLQHFATFTLVPTLLWAMLGNQFAWFFFFPLFFILFSIPTGEQLILPLQQVTAIGSVFLLKYSGIPTYTTGLYIEIPQGKFLVAEACSGISFFIACIVVGSAYSYLNFNSIYKRIAFTAFSMLLPVFANILRVYGIITIAFYSDMEYAAGADHLIYGGIFFTLVIFLLLFTGEFFRDKNKRVRDLEVININIPKNVKIPAVLSLSLLLGVAWNLFISSAKQVSEVDNLFVNSDLIDLSCASPSWKPVMRNPDNEMLFPLNNTSCKAYFYTAWFSEDGNELISSLNRSYDHNFWSQDEMGYIELEGKQYPWFKITTASDRKMYLVIWYKINDRLFVSRIHAKLYQLFHAMLGSPSSGRVIIMASSDDPSLFETHLRIALSISR